MIKKYLSILTLNLLLTTINAQTGKVGINTEEPTRTLDINGDLRVRTLSDSDEFSSILVAEDILSKEGQVETNVVKRAKVKGINLINDLEFPETMKVVKYNHEVTTGKIRDNQFTWVTLPAVPPSATQHLELSSDDKFYYVKTAGFYNIYAKMLFRVDTMIKVPITISSTSLKKTEDEFNGSFGLISLSLATRTNKDDINTAVLLDTSERTIFKGAKKPIFTKDNGDEEETEGENPIYTLYTSGSIFLPKGGRIGIQVKVDGANSIVGDLNNLYINPKTSAGIKTAPSPAISFINIYKNL